MNKKLIKTLACFAGISAIGSTTAIVTTSCGSNQPVKPVEKDIKMSWSGSDVLQCKTTLTPTFDGNISVLVDGVDCTNQYDLKVVTNSKHITINQSGKISVTTPFDEEITDSTIVVNAYDKDTMQIVGSYTNISLNVLPINILPYSVYEFVDENHHTLKGFTKDFLDHKDEYSDCNTMKLPRGVTSIVDSAFYKYGSTIPSYIDEVVLNKEVVTIGGSAFSRCSSLVFIDLSNCLSLTTIGDYAFRGCTSLVSFVRDFQVV